MEFRNHTEMKLDEILEKASRVIQAADALLISAGAGVGVDSGLPDFRGNKGFWKAYPPIAKLGISFVEMANPSWFDSDPKLAWAFYGHRLNLYRKTTPHEGFQQLLNLAKSKTDGYFVFTSNVDGHFQKAGFDSDKIEECHGSIHHFQCKAPCYREIWDAAEITVMVDEENFQARDPLPLCENCGRIARPNILMFGDWTWIPDRTNQQASSLAAWLKKIHKNQKRLAIIEVGAGEAVATVRYHSENIAEMHNATLIRINPRDYDVPAGHVAVPSNAKMAIDKIYRLIN
jgi:NAD-dependent SIR2 family protein deacetylase